MRGFELSGLLGIALADVLGGADRRARRPGSPGRVRLVRRWKRRALVVRSRRDLPPPGAGVEGKRLWARPPLPKDDPARSALLRLGRPLEDVAAGKALQPSSTLARVEAKSSPPRPRTPRDYRAE